MTVGSDNPFPSILIVEGAEPTPPAAGRQRLYIDSTTHKLKRTDSAGADVTIESAGGAVATDAIFDAKGDLAVGTGADTASKLTAGANDTILMADSGQATGLKWVASPTPSTQAFSDAAAEGTADTYSRGDHKHAMPADPGTSYVPPSFSGNAQNYAASGTTVAVTTTAYSVGSNLIAVINSTGRGANSITQTNVTWTNRYTGNGNSQWVEVWTGVVAGSPAGTTATANFTGSNKQQMDVFVLAGVGTTTSATIVGSAATSAGATSLQQSATAATAGDVIAYIISANSPASGYFGLNLGFSSPNATGGAGRFGLFRAQAHLGCHAWLINATSVATNAAFIKLS